MWWSKYPREAGMNPRCWMLGHKPPKLRFGEFRLPWEPEYCARCGWLMER